MGVIIIVVVIIIIRRRIVIVVVLITVMVAIIIVIIVMMVFGNQTCLEKDARPWVGDPIPITMYVRPIFKLRISKFGV